MTITKIEKIIIHYLKEKAKPQFQSTFSNYIRCSQILIIFIIEFR